jgi:hypothetical protein
LSVTITRGIYCRHLQQAPEEALGGFGISAFLNENVEHNAVLIHGVPKIMRHALDTNEHLVQVPLAPPGRGRRWRRRLAKLWPNFLH